MLNKYYVIYFNGVEEKIYKVLAHSKQEACDMFRKVVSRKYPIFDIINYSKVLRNKKIFTVLSFVVVATLLVALTVVGIQSWGKPEPIDYEEYIVSSGDTLWEIAMESNGWNRIENSYIVDDIQVASDCTALIHPGQVLYIPVYDLEA